MCFRLFIEITNMPCGEIHYPLCPKMLIPHEQGIWLLMWPWQWNKLTLWVVGEDEQVHTGSTSSWTKNGDSLWVSSKVADVFIEPAQGLDLVQQAIVPFSRLVPRAEKTCRVNENKHREEDNTDYVSKRGVGQKLRATEQHNPACLFSYREISHINRRWHPVIVRNFFSVWNSLQVWGDFTQKACQITHFWYPRWKYNTVKRTCQQREEESNRRHVSPTSRTHIYAVGAHPQQDKINWTKCHKHTHINRILCSYDIIITARIVSCTVFSSAK